MSDQKPIIPITVVITIALIAILMVGVAWWYEGRKEGNKNSNIVATKTVKIANGTVSISCNSDTDCTIVDREKDFSECCMKGPLDCSDFTQEKDNYIAVNSQSFDKLMENYKNLGDRCRGVPCNQYTAPYCPGGTSSDYTAKCSNGICKKVLKPNSNINVNIK